MSSIKVQAIALLLLLMAPLPARAAGHPNVIHVLIDDMGYADLGCYGNSEVRTPHIDRLAAEGLRFRHFYTNSPICSPSRTAWTTARYPARNRILSYLAHRQLNTERGMPQWLDANVWTVADGYRAAGYRTGHFGKWHMGGQRDVGEAPLIQEYGFDQSLTNFEGLGDRVLPLLNAFDGMEPKRHSLGSENLGRGEITWLDRDRVTGAFVSGAIRFIEEARKEAKPFFLNLWPDDVHSPFFPSEARSKLKLKRKKYLAVCEDMDRQLGVLFDHVRNDPSLKQNTIIVVTSDNGPEPGAGSADPYRGHKGQLYEGGIREPLIVWSPGLMDARILGNWNESSWLTACDVSRSLLAIGGVDVPAQAALDGENLSPTLLGWEAESRSAPALWVRPPDRPGTKDDPWPDLAIRRGDWKLLTMEDGSGVQLYDLRQDPTEQTNLAGARPAEAKELQQLALRWFADVFAGSFPRRPR